jgi:meromycolic acid enoyl-[acyl-carrier-protein] reductase
MGLLTDKTILVTGVLTEQSIAYAAAAYAQQEGAKLIFSSFGRRKKITEAIVRRLPFPGAVVELDVTNEDDLDSLTARLGEHTASLDGIIHCISASKPEAVGENFMSARWDDLSTSLRVSGSSLQAVTQACLPMLSDGASIVGVTLDGTPVWPIYGWAGVAKSTYEATSRYMAYHLGQRRIRTNLIACGPLTNFTMQAIENIDSTENVWEDRAPLGWDRSDLLPVAKAAVALLSDLFPATTGEIIHVDGGYHIMGV